MLDFARATICGSSSQRNFRPLDYLVNSRPTDAQALSDIDLLHSLGVECAHVLPKRCGLFEESLIFGFHA